jgi:succinate dehydrogenase / fumarate reductase cytochrome b subunit
VRTLGVARPSAQPLKRTIALVLAIVVALGFMTIPVAAMLGYFPEAPVAQESN